MKIFVFKFDNYFSGRRNFRILANSETEALSLLKEQHSKYFNDEETTFIRKEVVELNSPKIISIL